MNPLLQSVLNISADTNLKNDIKSLIRPSQKELETLLKGLITVNLEGDAKKRGWSIWFK